MIWFQVFNLFNQLQSLRIILWTFRSIFSLTSRDRLVHLQDLSRIVILMEMLYLELLIPLSRISWNLESAPIKRIMEPPVAEKGSQLVHVPFRKPELPPSHIYYITDFKMGAKYGKNCNRFLRNFEMSTKLSSASHFSSFEHFSYY